METSDTVGIILSRKPDYNSQNIDTPDLTIIAYIKGFDGLNSIPSAALQNIYNVSSYILSCIIYKRNLLRYIKENVTDLILVDILKPV
jgi:hypothetical protein